MPPDHARCRRTKLEAHRSRARLRPASPARRYRCRRPTQRSSASRRAANAADRSGPGSGAGRSDIERRARRARPASTSARSRDTGIAVICATGLPRSVIVIVSPPAASDTTADAFCLRARIPTSDMCSIEAHVDQWHGTRKECSSVITNRWIYAIDAEQHVFAPNCTTTSPSTSTGSSSPSTQHTAQRGLLRDGPQGPGVESCRRGNSYLDHTSCRRGPLSPLDLGTSTRCTSAIVRSHVPSVAFRRSTAASSGGRSCSRVAVTISWSVSK